MTEQDGELKKRIMRKAKKSIGFEMEGDVEDQIKEQILPIIEEAKQEFEKLIIVRKNKNPLLDSDEALDWLVKYFGETSK